MGGMNVTLTLDEQLVKKARKLAIERDTTLAAMIRAYLEKVVSEESAGGRARREREALDRAFNKYRYHVGKRTWKRSDLHERS
jgi:Family of unknown function (DUF6364)